MTIDDNMLRNMRRFEPASPGLAECIILAARVKDAAPRMSVTELFTDLLNSIFPRPAFALASVLIIGIAIGTILPVTSQGTDTIITQVYSDEGTTL